MRPAKRIPETLDLINQIWQLDQDMRFLQLIYYLQATFVHETNCNGKIELVAEDGHKTIGYDLFHVEDDEFIKFLKKELKTRKKLAKSL